MRDIVIFTWTYGNNYFKNMLVAFK